jgi:hypothetical protein
MELTVREAVQEYNVYPNVLHRLILVGKLDAHKNGDGKWLIRRASLDRWARTRRRGRPKQQTPSVECAEVQA